MGFAGQVFAARIAVGLAVPSAGALNRTGGVLAKAAGGIYSALAGKRKAAAAERLKAAKSDVDRLAKIADDNSKTTTARIAESAKSGVQRLEAIGKRGAATLRAGGKESMQAMKAGMGTEGDALFKGVQKSMTPLAKLRKLTENFATMSEGAQKRALKNAKEIVKAKEEDVETSKELLRQAQRVKQDLIDSGKATKEEMDWIDKKIKRREKGLKVAREERDLVVEEAEVIRGVAVQAQNAITAVKEENLEVTEELADATKELDEAQEELDASTKDLTIDSKAFGAAVTDVVNEAVGNFKEILVESIATMSAFYYKINQNTEALIDFERELINANSVWGETNQTMFDAGEQVTQFGQRYGMSMQNGATGLYQLASAGLTAAESTEVLDNTLKLSMAVQGDHNTIAKLTTQTLKGFDMSMSESAVITDKFAHAIQKSLIEYEDLSSAVKFALPFFTSTGQSVDQLLGSLQVLTNRALEAGIAGRGLRQALAEFAEGAEDNDKAFKKLGINILNAEGEMKQLTDIAAEFAEVVGEDTINNTELLTTLIDDLNVRGATAFVHLVQASDEFSQAVEDSANAGGELDAMVEKQNESLSAQIQILQNNVQAIFQFQDAAYEGTGYLNAFHEAVSKMIEKLSGLLVVEENGTMVLTDFGQSIQEIVVGGIQALEEVLMQIIPVIQEFSKQGFVNIDMIRLYTLPLRLMVSLLDAIGPAVTKMLLTFYVMNKIVPITTGLKLLLATATTMVALAQAKENDETVVLTANQAALAGVTSYLTSIEWGNAFSSWSLAGAKKALWAATGGAIIATYGWIKAQILAIFSTEALTAATIKANLALLAGWGAVIVLVIAVAKLIHESGLLQGFMEWLTEPGGAMYRWAQGFKAIGDVCWEIGEAIWYLIDGVGKLIKLVLSAPAAVSQLLGGDSSSSWMGTSAVPMATGGYIKPMASGGYLVGERGPELFRPNGGGQLLNNTATNHILGQTADAGFSGTGGGMVVSSLTVESAEMNQSNLNLDSFAGNPAMRRKA